MTDHETVDCRVGYTQGYRPAQGEGARHGKVATRVAEVTVAVEVVDPADAPVAVSLVRVDGLGTYDVRVHGGGYLRPVRAPGTWDACTLDAFRAAARGEVAWLDGPFHRPLDFAKAPSSLTARVTDLDGVAVRRWADDSTEAVAVAAAHSDMGAYRVVDGVVHVTCPEPTLHLSWFQTPGERLHEVTWRIGDVDQDDDPRRGSPGAPGAQATDSPRWTGRIGFDVITHGAGMLGLHATGAMRFRVDQAEGAEATLRDRMSDMTDAERLHRPRLVSRDVVAYCEPSLLGPDEGFRSLLRAFGASFARGREAFKDDVAPQVWLGRDTLGRTVQSPEVLRRWEEAGALVRALPTKPDAERARAAVEAAVASLAEIVPGVGHPSAELRWLRSRWDAFDAHRDLAEVLDPDGTVASDLRGLVL